MPSEWCIQVLGLHKENPDLQTYGKSWQTIEKQHKVHVAMSLRGHPTQLWQATTACATEHGDPSMGHRSPLTEGASQDETTTWSCHR